ncbi:hypothetical protein, partial [Roseiconus lacunae]
MKIDLHTHTKKSKIGDAATREIAPAKFCEILADTDVGIIAITNHNVFDIQQFEEIERESSDAIQVWPGIELDVVENGSRGHLIVIVSPAKAKQFFSAVAAIRADDSPDEFSTTIEAVLEHFEGMGPLYVAHYKQKKPDISDEAIGTLTDRTAHPCRVIKEVTNSISAGIYISHGQSSIYGSDVQDWNSYKEQSVNLPDLRLPVESFEHFCLLLEKDPTTINTVLNKKNTEEVSLTPFTDGTQLKLQVYNDINIVFGPKGTGKSCILKAIAKHYCDAGIEAAVYESASDRLDEIFDMNGRDLSFSLSAQDINCCKDEIADLRAASEEDVTSVRKYVKYYSSKTTNKNAKKIKLKDIDTEEEGTSQRQFKEFNEAANKTAEFSAFLGEQQVVKEVLTEDELDSLEKVVTELHSRLTERKRSSFSGWKKICLLNSAISKFRTEVERKTGSPAKPTTTGFRAYGINRAKIAASASAILESANTEIPTERQTLGSLGANKGVLELHTEFTFQNGEITDGKFHKLKGNRKASQQQYLRKGSQKEFVKKVRKILENSYKDNLFQYIAEFNEIEDIDQIESVYELLLFKRYFALKGSPYLPSSGEASMVMLQKELETNKDIYILDEPERSLGNEYINDVIVPLIKERAFAGKKVFISTHDANVAVRTLPY